LIWYRASEKAPVTFTYIFEAAIVFGNSAMIVQIALSDSFQAVTNGYLDNLSNLKAQIADSECPRISMIIEK
jgi:hypothetical protein